MIKAEHLSDEELEARAFLAGDETLRLTLEDLLETREQLIESECQRDKLEAELEKRDDEIEDLERTLDNLRNGIDRGQWVTLAPVISTAHLPQTTLSGLGATHLTYASYPEGVFIHVPSPSSSPAGLDEEEELKTLLRWAQENNHTWIRLDADGDEVSGLKTYEWSE